MSNLEGAILSEYLLLQCINKSGIADVYRAHKHGEGDYEVAVKVFRSSYAQQESFRNYFMTEAEKIGHFDHPNILPLLEFGEGEELLYVVTPFITAGTLGELLTRVGGRFSAMQAWPIIQQICSAVQYAHNHNVIHGNIKPSNIFLAADGRMLLSDFGIARSYDDSQQSLTQVGWGSAEYAAPEQSLGVLRRASDVYALGVLLFRILTGQPPFTGQTPVEVLLKHVRQPAPLARSLVPSISDAVDAVLQAAMQKRSDDRPPSPEELSNALLMAVTVAPVASPVAKPMVVPASQQPFGQVQPANNPRTHLLALTSSEFQTPPPPPFALVTRPLTQPLVLPQPSMDVEHSNIGADSTEKKPTDFLQDDIREDEHFFWSVDPVEWSPSVQVHSGPPTGNDYLQSKPVAMPTRPETPPVNPGPPEQKQDEQVERGRSARLNEVLGKLLPIIVIILLLIGLLGALLSSFFYPSYGHGAYMLPHGTQYVVVQTRYKEGSHG